MSTTLDYQVGSSDADCYWVSTIYSKTALVLNLGRSSVGIYKNAALFTGVTIPVGATINSAYLSFYYDSYVGTPPACTIYAEKAANPDVVTGYADGNGRSLTTNNVAMIGPKTGTWYNSDDISAIITELIGAYSYATGANMQFIVVGSGASGTNLSAAKTWDVTGNVSGPKLHIVYTAASGASVGLIGCGLCNPSTLISGVLVS
jgi:hypothetical protein